MTEVTSKSDQEMLINHIEGPLYLHYYLSSSWNSAMIAVMRWKYAVYTKTWNDMWTYIQELHFNMDTYVRRASLK